MTATSKSVGYSKALVAAVRQARDNERDAAALTLRRRAVVAAKVSRAMSGGVPAKALAEVCEVSVQRIYQLRDEHELRRAGLERPKVSQPGLDEAVSGQTRAEE